MWTSIKDFFKHSETIFWARVQAFIGFVAVVLTFVDPTLVTAALPKETIPVFLLLNGVATEYLRRRRTDM